MSVINLWREGQTARVIDLDDLKMPKGKPPFAVGDLVQIARVSADQQRVKTSAHSGWFAARRFEPL
jgi:hypothetical protein